MSSGISHMDSRLSSTIEWLRFVMACMVVLLHASGKGVLGHDPFSYIRIVFAHGICRVAVPVFFVVSGYLFFTKLQIWDTPTWIEKVKKRIHSLLIPYIVWNTIALFAFFFYAILRARLNGDIPITFPAFFQQQKGLMYLWNTSNGSPIDYPLWFIRDLILIVLGSPLIYYFLKKLGIYGLILLLLAFFLFNRFPQGLLFFSLGAYLQMNRKSLFAVFEKKEYLCYAASLVTLTFACILYFQQGLAYHIAQKGFIVFGTVASFNLANRLVGNRIIHRNNFLSRSSFFIYASHGILILDDFAFFICSHVFNGTSLISRIADLAGRTTLTILICLLLYYLIERFLPRTTKFLTGNRSYKQSYA